MATIFFYIYVMATSFFYIRVMATSFFFIYVMATGFFIYIDIYITFTNWWSVQLFYWTPFLKMNYHIWPQEPTYQAGETAILNCSFYLHSDQLYSVQWYKVEFLLNKDIYENYSFKWNKLQKL